MKFGFRKPSIKRSISARTTGQAKRSIKRALIPVAVSRLGEPEKTYRLTKEDVGHYIMAAVEPKHLRCTPGESVSAMTKTVVRSGQVIMSDILETDFQNFPCHNQPRLIPGTWTIGGYKPIDTAEYDWTVYPDKDYWTYGEGINGTRGTGLLQIEKGARLLYTPLPRCTGPVRLQYPERSG